MINENEVYQIGVINKPHGIKGELSFTFTTDVWNRVEADYLVCQIEGIFVPFFLEEYRLRTASSALLKFQGLENLEDVQELVGIKVFFPYALTPKEDLEEHTWQYFLGFSLLDTKGNKLGQITSVDESTSNVLFEVGKLLIPAAEALIQDIDYEARSITMHLPEGLTEL